LSSSPELGRPTAAILVRIIFGGCLMAMNECFARRWGYPGGSFGGWRNLWRSFRQAFFPLLTPVILVGGSCPAYSPPLRRRPWPSSTPSCWATSSTAS